MASPNKSRLPRSIYRQLLRWCQRNSPHPLPLDPLPPLTLLPPKDIDPIFLQSLIQNPSSFPPLPPGAIIESKRLILPLTDIQSIQKTVRLSFRLGKISTKERIATSLECLKTLNEDITPMLKRRFEKRQSHVNREGVVFSVGQVVRHKEELWRGVISGWSKKEDNNVEESESPLYTVIMDKGDAMMYNPPFVPYPSSSDNTGQQFQQQFVKQDDLDLVEDPGLTRIRNPYVETKFDHFNPSTNTFQPDIILTYEYPSDPTTTTNTDTTKPQSTIQQLSNQITTAIQSHATHLHYTIFPSPSSPQEDPLYSIEQTLQSIIQNNNNLTTTLQLYTKLSSTIHTLLTQRQNSLENKHLIRYPLGSIVKHTKYSFRGVVVGWDPKPTADVSNWDGLVDIQNAVDLPFYHVIPVQDDCRKVFGGERRLRYVCGENLRSCEDWIDVHLDWERDVDGKRFIPPDEFKFKYAEDMGNDEDDIVQKMNILKNEITNLHYQIQTTTNTTTPLSTNNLFTLLQNSTTLSTSTTIEEFLKEIFKSHPTQRHQLDIGLTHLLANRTSEASKTFFQILQTHNEYFEAWNKLATCHYLRGEIKESKTATLTTLEKFPKHFAAWSGLGLIYQDSGDWKEAVRCFRESLKWNPWGVVSTRLMACLDLLEGEEEKEGGSGEDANDGGKN